MRLLLDTHAFLWFVLNDPALSPKARDLIADPDNDLYFSPASHWEIAIKISIGKYQIPGSFAYLNYSDLKRNPLISPAGELPRSPTSTVVSLDVFMSGAAGVCCLFSRTKTCELQHVTVLGIFKYLSRWLRHPKNLFSSDRPSGSPF
jgi:hypothetical protein